MLSGLGVHTLRHPIILSPIWHGCRARAIPTTGGTRAYAWSRYSDRGNTRLRSKPRDTPSIRPNSQPDPAVIAVNQTLLEHNPDAGGLARILSHDTLVITRQIEMMNIFMGFEVANRYAINDLEGNVLGYIAEEERGFWGTVARQAFRTHRAFRSVIMDNTGTPVLWIHRPFSWINSRLFVQRKMQDPDTGAEKLVNFGEAQQEWHIWRRKYHLYLDKSEGDFVQFAQIDSGLWAWDFFLQNEGDVNIGSIRRGFRGLAQELFTDTGQYSIRFKPDPEAPKLIEGGDKGALYTPMNLEQRALVMALSVGVDFDYFSRHSEGSGMGFPFFWWMTGDGD